MQIFFVQLNRRGTVKVSLSYSPISMGRWSAAVSSTSEVLQLLSLVFHLDHSLLSFSRNSSVWDSNTSCYILIWRQEKCVALTAVYGVPLYFAHYCTASILMIQFHPYITSKEHHRLQHLQPPPPHYRFSIFVHTVLYCYYKPPKTQGFIKSYNNNTTRQEMYL